MPMIRFFFDVPIDRPLLLQNNRCYFYHTIKSLKIKQKFQKADEIVQSFLGFCSVTDSYYNNFGGGWILLMAQAFPSFTPISPYVYHNFCRQTATKSEIPPHKKQEERKSAEKQYRLLRKYNKNAGNY